MNTYIQELERQEDLLQLIRDIILYHPKHNVHSIPLSTIQLAYLPDKRTILLLDKESKYLILLTNIGYLAHAMGVSEDTLITQVKELV